MKKFITALTLAATVAACSPQEQVERAARECTVLGYAPQTIEHSGCVERGYRAAKQSGNASATTAVNILMLLALL